MLGIFFLIVLVMALVISTHSQGASEGLVHLAIWLKDQLIAFVLLLLRLLGRFMMWFVSLFPAGETEMLLPEPESAINVEEIAVEAAGNGGIFILILLGFLIAGAFIYLLYRLRGHRWQRAAQPAPPKGTAKRKSNRKNGFALLWKKILNRIHFEIAYLRNRKTASGLLVWTERKLKHKYSKRDISESPSAWLRRLAAENKLSIKDSEKRSSSWDPSKISEEFIILADLLEQEFYHHRSTELPNGFYQNYCQSVKKLTTILSINRV